MAIVQTINSVYQFEACFREAQRGNQFSWEGFKVLFDYLDNLSDDIGEPIDMDVVALCCEYSEDSIDDIISNYSIDVDLEDVTDEDEITEAKREAVKCYLEYHSLIAGETTDGFVYAVF